MSSHTLFDATIGLATRSLDLRSRRHELILSNITNADTPGYKAFDVLIDEALAKQLPQHNQQNFRLTHAAHLVPGGQPSADPQPQPVSVSTQVTLRGDGNTVDMDREMSNLAGNQLAYKASAQILANKFKGLLNVIKGGGS